MASSRHIQSPGIELNEIDRSYYGKTDYSLPNALAVLITGFADKGENYQTNWINTKNTFKDIYGVPTNEPEKFFYNAVCEILNRGGVCITAKLPYKNDSFNKMNYCDFKVSEVKNFIHTLIDEKYKTIKDIKETLCEAYEKLPGAPGTRPVDLSTLIKLKRAIVELYEYCSKSISPDDLKKIADLRDKLHDLIISYLTKNSLFILQANDNNLTSYLEITDAGNGKVDISTYDNHLINSRSVDKDTIRVYDITKRQYGELSQWKECVRNELSVPQGDCLGIVPVITTAANALYFQNLIDFDADSSLNTSEILNYKQYNPISGFTSLTGSLPYGYKLNFEEKRLSANLNQPITSLENKEISSNGYDQDSLSRTASLKFPTITFDGTYQNETHYSKKYLKQIGLVVFEAYESKQNNNKLAFRVVESFVGSLDRNAKDDILKNSIFIDDVVNANSQKVRLFSNISQNKIEQASIFIASQNKPISLGFYKADCKKAIGKITSIINALNMIFDQNKNSNVLPIDVVCDAGVSNIAQLVETCGRLGTEKTLDLDANPDFKDYLWTLKTTSDITTWKSILQKFDNFTKNQRKDCIFLADGIRTFCIEGNQKIVRRTKPGSSVEKDILPNLKFMSNVINSSYSAGYCNWFFQQDDYSGDYFWIPPSIKMAGVLTYCSTYFHWWDAPAGMTRGIIPNVVDCAFTPDENEAGKMYNQQWNFAINYPIDGIIAEGQKTFQVDKTALDRINIRMLMLYLEKRVVRIARRFVYEGNTAYLRQRFVDEIRPIFEIAVNGFGIKEYAIKCDDELNTTQVIENHEMRCRIAVKPIKVVEYIVLDFIVSNQSANVNEEVLK